MYVLCPLSEIRLSPMACWQLAGEQWKKPDQTTLLCNTKILVFMEMSWYQVPSVWLLVTELHECWSYCSYYRNWRSNRKEKQPSTVEKQVKWARIVILLSAGCVLMALSFLHPYRDKQDLVRVDCHLVFCDTNWHCRLHRILQEEGEKADRYIIANGIHECDNWGSLCTLISWVTNRLRRSGITL